MSARELISEHLDLWTGAVRKKSSSGRGSNGKVELTGVKKLRELILELAVRGKLLPQNGGDAPVSQLLDKASTGRENLVAKGILKRKKSLPDTKEEEHPFELPSGWKWVRLGEIVHPQAGFAFKSRHFNDTGKGLPLIRIRDVGQEFSGTYYSGEYKDEFVLSKGDYLISMDGVFRVAQCTLDKALLNQRVTRLIFHSDSLSADFIATSLQLRLIELQGVKAYTTVDHLSGKQISEAVIGLPPEEEQHRIVQKVDELIALCDRLEQQTSDQLEAHETLVDTLLGTLTQSENATELADNWVRLAAHFDTLFSTEHSIDRLKQTILQLAVMGRLVEQDVRDEPAYSLLNRLTENRQAWLQEQSSSNAECKTMLRKLGKLRPAQSPFSLPKGWQPAHLIQLCRMLVDCHNKTAPYVEEGIPIIRTSNIRERRFNFNEMKYVDEDTYTYWSRRCPPEPGDIIFTREAPMGEAAIIPEGKTWCLGQRTMLVRPMHEHISNSFLLLALTEHHLLERAAEKAIGSTVKHLRVGDVENLVVPVPPLDEQHRIVQKVDELMALCDQLKERLNKASETRCQLAEAVVAGSVH